MQSELNPNQDQPKLSLSQLCSSIHQYAYQYLYLHLNACP